MVTVRAPRSAATCMENIDIQPSHWDEVHCGLVALNAESILNRFNHANST